MSQPLRLWLEWIVLFLVLPFIISLIDARLVVFGLLWGAAFLATVYVYKHKGRDGFQWHATRADWQAMGCRFILASIFLLGSAFILIPDKFLNLPMTRPYLWVMIMLLYPLLSAIPQEAIYRAYMHLRYQPIFQYKGVFYLASGTAFAIGHLIFGNFVALILAFAGGMLFGHTYRKSNSFGLVCVEHALYGIMVFTSGWGWYFYLGAGHHF